MESLIIGEYTDEHGQRVQGERWEEMRLKVGGSPGRGTRPSDLGFGSVIFGLGTIMEDGQEGTTQEAGRQAEDAAFCR